MKKKNEAASALAHLRWSKMTKKQRQDAVPRGLGGAPRKYPKCPKYRAHVFHPETRKCYGCGFLKPSES